MSGYQEVATDPSFEGQIVCFTAPMIGNYGVDEARNESRRAHAKAVVMRDARGPGVDRLAARARGGRAHRRRHPLARPASARPRCDARGCGDRATRRSTRFSPRCGRSPRWPAPRSSPVSRRASSTRSPPKDAYASRWSTTAASARSCAGSRVNGAAVDVFPHDVDADSVAGYDGVLLSPGPGDPAPLTDETRDARAAARPHAGARCLPRPSAARARDRQGDVQAAVRPSRREPSGARSPHARRARHRRRTTASRSPPATSPA